MQMSPKMNSTIKAKWVAALRSKQYTQGKNTLRSEDNKFCCLGVLCNLHAQAHPKIAAMQDDPTSYMRQETILPREVANWAGLEDLNPSVRSKVGDTTLAQLNDILGVTFRGLATIIEKQL